VLHTDDWKTFPMLLDGPASAGEVWKAIEDAPNSTGSFNVSQAFPFDCSLSQSELTIDDVVEYCQKTGPQLSRLGESRSC
jgi:hypothetical protein